MLLFVKFILLLQHHLLITLFHLKLKNMETSKILLPYKFKLVGWCILIPALILGIVSYAGVDIDFSIDDIRQLFHLPAIHNNQPFSLSSFSYDSGIFITIIGILLIIGGIFVGFSKNKCEDEFITKIRLESLTLAVYINYLMLIVCFICFWGLEFLAILQFNLFTTLLVFIICFYIRLAINKRSLKNEK